MTVREQQLLLSFLGYYTGAINGTTSPQSATRQFQQDYSLGVDGIFGPTTEAKIREVIGNPDVEKKSTTIVNTATGDAFWSGLKYFTKDEFRCPCGKCGGYPVEPNHQLVLEMEEMLRSA